MSTTLTDTITDLTITREFTATRDQVWKAWTDPEMAKRWWGPKQFTCPYSAIDLHVGGKYLLAMRDPDEKDYWSTGVYKELVPGEKIVATDSFADKDGNVVSSSEYGMEGLPRELLVTVTFEDAGPGKTKMTLRHNGFPEGEMKTMASQGWNESFDKMEKLFT